MRSQYGALPDLFFPADRSWLASALWDDTWTCIGGPAALIEILRQDPSYKPDLSIATMTPPRRDTIATDLTSDAVRTTHCPAARFGGTGATFLASDPGRLSSQEAFA